MQFKIMFILIILLLINCQKEKSLDNLNIEDLYGTFVSISNNLDTIQIENKMNDYYYFREQVIIYYSKIRIKDKYFLSVDNKNYIFSTYINKKDTINFEIFDAFYETIYYSGYLDKNKNINLYIKTENNIQFYEKYEK